MCSLSISSSRPGKPDALKRSLLSILLFIALFFVCDRLIFFVLNTGFRKTTTGTAGGMINKILQEKFDIVILGSSRAVLHYDPRVLGSKLNMSAYNAGRNGFELYYVRGVVDLILKKQKPTVAIIDIDAGSVLDAEIDLNKAAILAPFMGESKIIKSMLYSKSPLERLKYLSLSYRFNDKPFSIVKNLFIEEKTIAGFTPDERVMDPEKAMERPLTTVEPERTMMNLLRETISQLKGEGAHVVLVLSPRWSREGRIHPNRISILREIISLAQSEQVSFLTVTIENTPVFQKSKYFKDPSHLNAEGAKLFSEILAEKLAVLMKNQFEPVYDEL